MFTGYLQPKMICIVKLKSPAMPWYIYMSSISISVLLNLIYFGKIVFNQTEGHSQIYVPRSTDCPILHA